MASGSLPGDSAKGKEVREVSGRCGGWGRYVAWRIKGLTDGAPELRRPVTGRVQPRPLSEIGLKSLAVQPSERVAQAGFLESSCLGRQEPAKVKCGFARC